MTQSSERALRIGSALFNANHGQLAEEVRKIEQAGIDFLHFDVFDGHFVPDLAFSPRIMLTLRPLTQLPFEVHLAAQNPERFLPALARSGANLVFLPAESTPLLYETIFSVREHHMRVGLCLALGTSLQVLEPVLPMLDAVLLLGRVTGEGQRGRTFNNLLLPRIREVRSMIDAGGYDVDVQAAGGLETADCQAAVVAGATSLPIGGALHRETDMSSYVSYLRSCLTTSEVTTSITETHEQKNSKATQTYRVLVASRSFGPNCPDAVERMKEAGCELIPNDLGRAPTEEELLERVGNIDVLISGTEPVTERVLAAASNLKVISKHGVGYENIDLEAAKAHGIPVAVVGGAIVDSVADMALALLLAAARKIPQGNTSVRDGKWKRMVGVELREKTIGIVGLGQIGKGVCRRAKGFGMHVLAFDVYQDEQFAKNWNVHYVTMEELLANSDFVSLHAPVSPETRYLISKETLQRMKPTAFLINTSRGELVDEEALATALREGKLAGAASDVFQKEPPGDNPLLKLNNFIASPHSAGQTEDGLRRMGEIAAENALRVLAGQKPLYQVV
jgi:D-3-phosphoglycerate dehydrogenase